VIQSDRPGTPKAEHTRPDTRRPLVLALDLLIVAAAALALVALAGGFVTMVAGLRLSVRAPARPLLVTGALVLLRLWIAPTWLPFAATREQYGRLGRRLYASGAEGAVLPAASWRATLAAAVGLCVAAVVLLYPQVRHMDSVPDFGDPFLSMWRSGWVYEQLRGDPRPLFDANIFYPEPLTLTYSDSMLLPALSVAPLLAAGVHPVTAYNVLLISGFVLSGLAAYMLVVRLTGSAMAGFVSGLVFGFYPYHFEHYSHLELQMMQWMPLALVALHRFIETARPQYALAAALCAAAQLYSSMYYGVFFAIYATVVVIALVMTVRPPLRRLWLPALLAAAVAGTLVLPLARPYAESTRIKGERTPREVKFYSATPSDYLRAHPRSALYGVRMLPGRQPERALFPGVVPLALAAVGALPPLGALRLAYVAGLAVAFDGSLGFNGLTYPHLYDWVMPIRGLRVPARFSVLVALSLAVLSGFAARRILARTPPRARPAVFAVLVAAAVANAWPTLDLRPAWREPPPIYGGLGVRSHAVLVEFPFPDDYAYNGPYLYFSLWHWTPLVNGYSGYMPRSYEDFFTGVRGFPDQRAFETMRARGVTHFSVNCGLYRGGCEQLLEHLETLPGLHRVAEGRWQGKTVRLYELAR
jgi:hypothetical protein